MTLDLFDTKEHDPGGKVKTSLPAGMTGNAYFCGENNEYRPYLYRRWGDVLNDPNYVMFVGMNPSTADANSNDPTLTRMIGFASKWGYPACYVCNVLDYRATFPKELIGKPACSDENIRVILSIAKRADRVVVCYGVLPSNLHDVAMQTINQLRLHNIRMWCFGRTLKGHPRHPLYLRSDTPLETFT